MASSARRFTIFVIYRRGRASFHPGDKVKIRLKSRQPGPSKFKSEWSVSHQVVRVRSVLVTVREVSTGREYNTHNESHSNPIFSRKPSELEYYQESHQVLMQILAKILRSQRRICIEWPTLRSLYRDLVMEGF